jgi:hypothetical protein
MEITRLLPEEETIELLGYILLLGVAAQAPLEIITVLFVGASQIMLMRTTLLLAQETIILLPLVTQA